MRFWIIAVCLFCIFIGLMLLLSLYHKYSNKIKKFLLRLKNLMFFNQLIDTVTLMYMQLCKSVGV